MDGNGTLFATLTGQTRTILHKFSVDLPKKHARGGQSALRFARLRLEKRHNYIKRVCEMSKQIFITNDKPNIKGLILAGSADFKNKLAISEMLDMRLRNIIVKVVDVCYGGENGFNEALDLTSSLLSSLKYQSQRQLLTSYFTSIARDTGKICYGIRDVMSALEVGGVETLMLWEDLGIRRYRVQNKATQVESLLYLTPQQSQDSSRFRDKHDGTELEIIENESFLDWITQAYEKYGCQLVLISDKSPEGCQFVRGFGGIGAILRYVIELTGEDEEDEGEWDM